MAEPTESHQVASWKSIVLQVARDSFAHGEKGVLLSTIPSILRRNGIDPEETLKGYRVRLFLETFGRPELNIFQHEKNPALWIVLPGEVQLEKPPSAYFPQAASTHYPRSERFQPAVWKAFVSHLPEGFRRWIHLQPRAVFADLPETEDSEAIPIEREFIQSPDANVQNVEVVSRIEKWAALHQVQITDLIFRETAHLESRRPAQRRVLEEFLDSLSVEELRRFSIPADIVAKFL